MFIFDLFTDIHGTILPFQVKGVGVDIPRPFKAREKGAVTHPAYPLRNGTVRRTLSYVHTMTVRIIKIKK
jgi:hypothetical protein